MRVLLVEDDRIVADYVKRGLEEEHYTVSVCFDGTTGLRAAETSSFDIIVLDIMLPLMDGLSVTRRLRRQNIQIPILLLTGRDAPEDVVRGLDAGADDYLTKPFAFDVLLARIRARTRTAKVRADSQLRFEDLTIDFEKHEAWRGKTSLHLTRTEFSILECLMRAAGRVVTRDHLINTVWGDRELCNNNLDVFIRFLRTKVDLPDHPKLIHTERGIGYRLLENKC
jgi:two-component system, OmpR family, copper resistance phosphate regulon response regulator CusR